MMRGSFSRYTFTLCCAVLCCAVLCCAMPCRAVLCNAMLCHAMPLFKLIVLAIFGCKPDFLWPDSSSSRAACKLINTTFQVAGHAGAVPLTWRGPR